MLKMFHEIQLISRILTARTPHIVFFATSRCNLKCQHCFNWKNAQICDKNNELNLNEIKKMSKSLGKLHYLTLTGGEPTLREDIVDVINVFYKQNDVKELVFHSNGFFPKKLADIAEKILKNCPNMDFTISISLDGMEETHDKIRGKKGSFKKVLESYNVLKNFLLLPNFHIDFNTTLMSHNKKEIDEINQFVINNFNASHDVTYLRGDVRNFKTRGNLLREYENITKIIEGRELSRNEGSRISLIKAQLMTLCKDIIVRVEKEKKCVLPCKALKKSLVISEEGEIFPCEMINESLGNLRDFGYDIKKVLKVKKARDIKSIIKSTKCKCTWECMTPVNAIFSLKGNIMLTRKLYKGYKDRLFGSFIHEKSI